MTAPSKTQQKENREALAEALRYGGYVQANGTMRRGNEKDGFSYCCLGVACNVYKERTGFGEWETMPSTVSSKFTDELGEFGIGVTPSSVDKYFGIDWRYEDSLDAVSTMVEMNDVHHDDFDTIADFVDSLE